MTEHTGADDLRRWLSERMAHHVDTPVARIRPDVLLSDYGLDSVAAVSLAADIEDELGMSVDPAVVWDHPTIDELVGFLTEEMAARSAE